MMATVLFSAAGQALGGAVGGSIFGIGAATIGQAVGAVAGSLVDQALLGGSGARQSVGRATSLRLVSATEGAAIPQVWGRMRLAGQMIWSTRFKENVRVSQQGGKATGGGAEVAEYSYTISLGIALCEGPILRIGRIWADGKPFDGETAGLRVYLGTEDQLPDPKIEAVEGAERAPAYRGTAYVVIEDLALAPFGNRIPQFNFEVFRQPDLSGVAEGAVDRGPKLAELVRAVALSPGTGEFVLDTRPVEYRIPGQPARFANMNTAAGKPDLVKVLDDLQAELPNCAAVSLVVSWFGDDLRCGRCRIRPGVERRDRVAHPAPWRVAGLDRLSAPLVSADAGGRPNFGGAPDDGSVIRAVAEHRRRGLAVMLYPFLLMDIPAGNGLGDPYGGVEQAAFPWRGRITLDQAPGRPGSTDQTPAAEAEVAAFFGTARAADFAVANGAVVYSGDPDDWGWRRFVLHLAALGAAGGGVDSICIGSEFRGLSTIRSGRATYPAVAQFRALAAEVRQILPEAKIGYAADWTEYANHRPDDGSNDVIFHLDPLWADPNIDFVGIDDYTPLSDLAAAELDPSGHTPALHEVGRLAEAIAGGEHYDYFYADDAARAARLRSPIRDTAHGEDWVFRAKDFAGWWGNAHHDRVGGVRAAGPTGWVPGSKPIWLTEIGSPAVHLGANQPNLFYDPKSSESALPFGSDGSIDELGQRRFLEAKLSHWVARPPVDRVFVWTWDARPWPEFPNRTEVWSDGALHRYGHWITGRIARADLAEIIAEQSVKAGVAAFDVRGLGASVTGYMIDQVAGAADGLAGLLEAFEVDAVEGAAGVRFVERARAARAPLNLDRLVAGPEGGAALAETRAEVVEARHALSFHDPEADYAVASVELAAPFAGAALAVQRSVPASFSAPEAEAVLGRIYRAASAQTAYEFTLPPSALAVEVGDMLEVSLRGAARRLRVVEIAEGLGREVKALEPARAALAPGAVRPRGEAGSGARIAAPGYLELVVLDVPLVGVEAPYAAAIAARSDPWVGPVRIGLADDPDAPPLADLRKPALIGALLEPLAAGAPGRWQGGAVRVALHPGALFARPDREVLAGANDIAVEGPDGAWEVLAFQEAALVAPGEYRVGRFLRGLRGTGVQALSPGARVVVLDDAVQPLALDPEREGAPVAMVARRPGAAALARTDFAGRGDRANLRPYAPAHLGLRAAGGDLEIAWVRCTRVGGDGWAAAEVPLGESVERYRLVLAQGGMVRRVVEVPTPAYRWTAAERAADGAVPGPLVVRVAQYSSEVGWGAEARLVATL